MEGQLSSTLPRSERLLCGTGVLEAPGKDVHATSLVEEFGEDFTEAAMICRSQDSRDV